MLQKQLCLEYGLSATNETGWRTSCLRSNVSDAERFMVTPA